MLFISLVVLELHNLTMKQINMKNTKTMLLPFLSLVVTFAVGLWLYSSMDKLGIFEFTVAGFVVIAVIVSLTIGIKRMKDQKMGLAVEVELSHRIKQKAAASAFFNSFYLWTLIAMFTIDSNLRIEIPIGIGILGMSLLFIGFRIYYSKSGIIDENSN